jgi:hypothetical protein
MKKTFALILMLLCMLAIPAQAQHTIAWAKAHVDGTTINENVPSKIVTYTFSEYGYFYVQEPDRFMGIRVYASTMPAPGDEITITGGTLTTTEDGERAINSATYTTQSHGHYPFDPIGMTNKSLGGGDFICNTPSTPELLQNVATEVAVHLQDGAMPPSNILNVAYNATGLNVTYQKFGGAVETKTLTSENWTEQGAGTYKLHLTSSECDTLSLFSLWVTYPSATNVNSIYNVVTTFTTTILGQRGVTTGSGLNNIGILVKSWGKITEIDSATPPTYYWMTDGSGVDTAVNLEVAPGQVIPIGDLQVDSFVAPVGISTMTAVGDNYVRVVYPDAPTSKITQATGQVDPTSVSPITFVVRFSEPVSDFDSADIVLGGTALPLSKTVVDVDSLHTTYTVAIAGMSKAGTVTIDVPEYGAATSIAYGASSLRTKLIDNQVTWSTRPSIRIINKRIGVGGGRIPKRVLK